MTVTFDPYGEEYVADPYRVYKQLRDEAPVFHSPDRNFWALSRFEDVMAAHRDVKRFLSRGGVTIEGHEAGMPFLILKDPPEHAWHKSLVTRVFTRTRMAELEPFIRERTVQLLAAAAKKPSFDFVSEFAVVLPLDVISRLLDIPEEWREEYHQLLSYSLSRGEDFDLMKVAQANQRVIEVFAKLVAERRASPRDDVITLLLQSEVKDEEGKLRKLDDLEVAFRFNEMGAAGHETSAKAIANAAMIFARFPEQKRLLAGDRSLMPKAVNEILRLEPPSQMQGRTTATDVTLHGITIPEGQKVMLLTGSATRDERVFPNPDRCDITRDSDTRSLHFGFGIHKCLGMHLATLEITVALEELFSRYPNFEVRPADAVYPVLSNVRGPSSLPGSLNARSPE